MSSHLKIVSILDQHDHIEGHHFIFASSCTNSNWLEFQLNELQLIILEPVLIECYVTVKLLSNVCMHTSNLMKKVLLNSQNLMADWLSCSLIHSGL